MRVVFLGTPEFAVPALERLAAAGEISLRGVICQGDRPAGRGLAPRPPAVKLAALRLGLPVFQPERLKSDDAQAWLATCRPDALAVVAYGQILPARVFELPRWGAINAHASLLPAYRGAAPIQWAIARGETLTGVTTMRIEAGLDTGPTLLHRELPIAPDETAPQLSRRLATLAADLLLETLAALAAGQIAPQPQNDSQATLAPLLTKEDGRAVWSLPAATLYNCWRGFQPWPGLFTRFRGQQLKLLGVRPLERDAGPPGAVTLAQGELVVACGQGALQLDQVQLEGRAAVAGAAFARGARLRPGEALGA